MTNLKTYKRIFGVVFVLFLTFFTFSVSVKALTTLDCNDPSSKCCKRADGSWEEMPDQDVIGRYGLTAKHLNGNDYQISMIPPNNYNERCYVTFNITAINGKKRDIQAGDPVLTCNTPIAWTVTDTVSNPTNGLNAVSFELTSNDYVVKNEGEAGSCYYKEHVTATFYVGADLQPQVKGGTCDTSALTQVTTSKAIDCTHPAAGFEEKFCNAKTKAIADGKSFDLTETTYAKSHSANDYIAFKCESDVTKIPTKEGELDGEKYYVNKNYVYGKSVKTINNGNYVLNHSPGESIQGPAITCEVSCEEAVEVEYGPPVASKAGMCFEYKVRVTSRVSCGMTKAPTPPPSDCSYCTPTPHCVSTNGHVYTQAGPAEDFDACVKKCDGGNYSNKCSRKCYSEVYGNKSKIAKTTLSFLEAVNAERLELGNFSSLEDCFSVNPNGCYVRSGESIDWKPGPQPVGLPGATDPLYLGEGRFYTEADTDNPAIGANVHSGRFIIPYDDGFWRADYRASGGDYCRDECSWLDCGSDMYINPGIAQKDYDYNVKLYNDAVNACQAKATCSTTTAEFTITAKYNKGGSEVPIVFPYNSEPDFIKHGSGSQVSSSLSNPNTTFLEEDNGIDGCYLNGNTAENYYRATWGFPGTWINLKTGEISYTPKSSTASAWYEHKNRFCVPHDAESVNSDWWNKYYHKVISESSDTYQVYSTEVKDKCKTITENNTILTATPTSSSTELVYNIVARTTKFGYFEWLLEMDCFYALNPKPTSPTTTTTTTMTSEEIACTPTVDNYEIRTVNLEDVFPSTEGTVLSNSNQAGRMPGFNWSSAANGQKKNTYLFNPEKYLAYIQGNGNAIYKNENLDYEFNLSPQDIRKMRKENNGSGTGTNYTNFNNDQFYIDSNGISRYKSVRINTYTKKRPDGNAVECNNMVNYASSECETGFKD